MVCSLLEVAACITEQKKPGQLAGMEHDTGGSAACKDWVGLCTTGHGHPHRKPRGDGHNRRHGPSVQGQVWK